MRVGLPRATRVSTRLTGRLTQWLATLLAIGGSTADISALDAKNGAIQVTFSRCVPVQLCSAGTVLRC
jgi:hypothetical protein